MSACSRITACSVHIPVAPPSARYAEAPGLSIPLYQPDSLIPNGSSLTVAYEIDQALYLPLFYGDAQGVIHPGAASEVPTVQNGGINADATTWTFHLRPHLVWSDGQPYDARDVDYTWKLWLNPKFGANLSNSPIGLQVISSAVVSTDHLTITFHLKQPYVPFLQYWVDGWPGAAACAPFQRDGSRPDPQVAR